MQSHRVPTSQDVAQLAGVSRATVSYVLNGIADSRIPEATAERVRQAASELRYKPSHMARALSRGRSDVVLALLPPARIAANEIEVMAGLATRNLQAGQVFMPMFLTGEDAQDAVNVHEICEMLRPTVVIPVLPLTTLTRAELESAGVRVLVADRDGASEPLNLDIDELYGAAQAEALLEGGAQTLAYAWPSSPVSQVFAQRRLAGFRRRAQSVGARVIRLEADIQASTFDALYRESQSWQVDGLAGFDDDYAIGVVGAVLRAGAEQPPLVVGVDDAPFAAVSSPSLSSVYPTQAATGYIVESLQAMMRGEQVSAGVVDEHVAVVHRQTTAPGWRLHANT